MNDVADKILACIGPAVLLSIPSGQKGPRINAWQKLTVADMTPEYLAGLNHGDNIGVSLGEASGGLCSVDCDSNDLLETFVAANPALAGTLITRGARGGNIWVRIIAEYPKSGVLKYANGARAGEWRATGNQTIIRGKHPSGVDYKAECKSLIHCEFSAINWPSNLTLPWIEPPPATEVEVDEAEADFIGPNGVILPSGNVSFTTAAKRIFTILAKAKGAYLGSGVVCAAARANDGALRLEPVSDHGFRSLIERHCNLFAWRAGPHEDSLLKAGARCSLDSAKVIMAAEERKILPPVAAVHSCPLLIECRSGCVEVLSKGYHDKAGGRLIVGGDMPQQMDISEAADTLLGLLDEFDFATPADMSRAIAAILSPALKGLGTVGVHFPVFIIEANDSQAGKGFLLDVAHAIYREVPSLVTQRNGGVGGFDESLSQALINGRPFVQFDNVRGRIDSTFLEAIMTCPLGGTVAARVPHKGEIQVNPDSFTFQLTSNGLVTTPDFANRSCFVRIRKRPGFVFRDYPEGNLLDHVIATQPGCLSAVYSIVAHWVSHGKPVVHGSRGEGRFRHWWEIAAWIAVQIFNLPSPLDGHEIAQARAANPTLAWLRSVYLAIANTGRLQEWLSATEIVEFCREEGLPVPGLSHDATDSKAVLRVGVIMGDLFKDGNCVQGEGFELRRSEEMRLIESSGQEKPLKKYAFWEK